MPKTMKSNSPLLESISQDPLLVNSISADLFAACIEHMQSDDRVMAEINNPTDINAVNDNDFWGNGGEDDWRTYYRPYKVSNGVLQIPVSGMLIAKFTMTFGRWATGYKYIEMALKRGLADSSVRAIAMVFDSPGGMVTDCFELCAKVYDARSKKPVRAFAADNAYSAAYALACSTSHITVTSSGGVGSVGVVTMHISYADMLAKAGMKVTFISAGEGKTDGNPYENLSEKAQQRIQMRITKVYGVFVSTVSKGRGMTEDEVKAVKAYTYDAEDGVANKLADKIGALDEELAQYAAEFADQGDYYMTTTQGNVTGQKPAGSDSATVSLENYRADVNAAEQKGLAQGRIEGSKDQRLRIAAIMGCEEAKDKPKATAHIAMNSDMSVDEAKAFLAGMPVEQAAAPVVDPKANPNGTKAQRNHFQERMDADNHPNVGATDGNGSGNGDEPTAEDKANSILAAFGAHTGIKPSASK